MNTLNRNYKVKRILNNSSLIASDLFFEVVIMGKGIAFGLKPNDTLKRGVEYDKMYKLLTQTNEFNRIINGFDDHIVDMVMDTVAAIGSHGYRELQTQHFITLSDHLAAAYTRILRGEPIVSFFSLEIKALYPQSYDRAVELAKTIESKHDLKIPEAELTYIALHIENLTSKHASTQLDALNVLIGDINELLDLTYHVKFDRNTVHYSRFLTHIRFIIEGALANKRTLSSGVNEALISAYPTHVEIAGKIIEMINKEMNIQLDNNELSYLVIHLVNILGDPIEYDENPSQ
ncbi:PRD domain-containing protein [Erysipelothrix inopinata]|uniref:PRD domain-containing protein n=1 Tax=Erysipelothrix inopinata TaxID=225084 RepID=A0A7G9S129_9FIRM|nr:PRD domain-containing protein [Erysipelothrix inopinata]QNN61554.1 PRD domain-containing protein [Erysipelothrix inopinata]